MIKIILVFILTINIYAGDTVIDKDTDMMWQDNSTIVEKDYNGAMNYCKNLSLDGYNDWRLPNIDELISITDKNRYKPAIKKIFKNTENTWYWSSSKYKGDSSDAWIVYFYDGGDRYNYVSNTHYVRCVR